MQLLLTFLLLILAISMFATMYCISIYNSIIRHENEVKNAFSQIDVQLKRRYDLIPNLVETVKGYAEHEKSTLTDVINARAAAISANARYNSGLGDLNGVIGQSEILNNALGKLLAVVESYPELKANENFIMLMEELSSTENRISFARQGFNDAAMYYNNIIQVIPASLIAGITHKTIINYLVSTKNEEERSPVAVSFK